MFENLALVRSGLGVCEDVGVSDSSKLHSKIMDNYIDNIEYWSNHAKDFAELRPFIDAMTAADKASLGSGKLDGLKLWKKWKLLSAKLINEAIPIWASLVGKDDEPPTGTNIAEMLLKVRKAIWGLTKSGLAAEEMKLTWYPSYWLCFIH